jgi:CheY-like chemotaxis protein
MNDTQRRRILLVDDDPSLLTTLADFLAFEGYDVETAESGEAALMVLDQVDPDLIILDMSMPGIGGVGFLREISDEEGQPSHSVLVLTARANMAEFFANVDVDGFVAKPCEPNDLLMEVSRIIFLRSGDTPAGGKRGPARRLSVLLGEDRADESERLAGGLTRMGFRIDCADRGPDVLEKAIVARPDVVLLRCGITGMEAEKVAEMLTLMPNTKRMPVVIYDAGVRAGDIQFAQGSGGVQAIVEDSMLDSLIQAMEQVTAKTARKGEA